MKDKKEMKKLRDAFIFAHIGTIIVTMIIILFTYEQLVIGIMWLFNITLSTAIIVLSENIRDAWMIKVYSFSYAVCIIGILITFFKL